MLNNFHRKKCLLWSKSSRSWLSFYCHGEWESLEICRNVGSSAIWGEWVEWISEWRKNKSNKNNAEEFRYSNRQISDVQAWNCLLFFEFLQLNLDSQTLLTIKTLVLLFRYRKFVSCPHDEYHSKTTQFQNLWSSNERNYLTFKSLIRIRLEKLRTSKQKYQRFDLWADKKWMRHQYYDYYQ